MDTAHIIQELISTVLAGGKISMDRFQQQQSIAEKPDRSWVTATDLEVENYIRGRLALLSPESPIVGEEGDEAWTPVEVDRIFEAKTVWSIDPIDGTANYVNRFGNWAISVGLLQHTDKGLQPWLGTVYYPRQDVLLYADGQASFEISKAGTPQAVTSQLLPITYTDIETVRLKTFPINANKFGRWNTKKLRNVRVMGSTIVHLGGVATGSAAGSLTKAHLWDLAGILAVCRPLGIHLTDPESGTPLTGIERHNFNFDSKKGFWNLTQDYLVSNASAAPFLLDLLERLPS